VERVAHGQHRVRPPRGLVVLDVDKQHDGPSNLAALTQFHGQLPPTWSASTGGGGCHLWFRAGGPFRGQLCEGVDIKAHTGYLVVPPSVHPNGTCYVWDNDLPIVDAPEWILPLLCTPRTPVRPPSPAGDGMRASGLVRYVASAPVGSRNRLLYWAACRTAERGAPPRLLEPLRDAARSTGLSDEEIDRTIASALRGVGA